MCWLQLHSESGVQHSCGVQFSQRHEEECCLANTHIHTHSYTPFIRVFLIYIYMQCISDISDIILIFRHVLYLFWNKTFKLFKLFQQLLKRCSRLNDHVVWMIFFHLLDVPNRDFLSLIALTAVLTPVVEALVVNSNSITSCSSSSSSSGNVSSITLSVAVMSAPWFNSSLRTDRFPPRQAEWTQVDHSWTESLIQYRQ